MPELPEPMSAPKEPADDELPEPMLPDDELEPILPEPIPEEELPAPMLSDDEFAEFILLPEDELSEPISVEYSVVLMKIASGCCIDCPSANCFTAQYPVTPR